MVIVLLALFRRITFVVFVLQAMPCILSISISLMFLPRIRFKMRRLNSICKRLYRLYGVRFAVVSPKRGEYSVSLFCDNLGDWFSLRTCKGVVHTVDYLLAYELVKKGVL